MLKGYKSFVTSTYVPHFLRIVRARVSPSPLTMNRYPTSHVALLACAQSNSERPFYSLTKLHLPARLTSTREDLSRGPES